LWHGASWNFVLWGAFHGFFLIIERLTGLANSYKFPLIRTGVTFLIVVLSWVVFRLEHTSEALSFYSALFSFDGITPIYYYNNKLLFVLGLAVFFGFQSVTKLGKKWQDHFYNQNYSKASLAMYFSIALVLFTLSVASLSTGSYNPFIYFRF
jgi:alginate O-acetyltransferase complex protein AlgI